MSVDKMCVSVQLFLYFPCSIIFDSKILFSQQKVLINNS